jgi:hypothetical protein
MAPAFDLGTVTVAGVTVPFPSAGSSASALAVVDRLAAPLGVQLRLPTVQRATNGGNTSLTITPLTIALGGKTAFGPVFSALVGGATVPQIENDLKPGIFDPTACTELGGLLEGSKPLNAEWNLIGSEYPLILGATIAALNGGGEVDVDLGGVTTSLDDSYYPAANFGGPAFSTSPGSSSISTPPPAPLVAVPTPEAPPRAAPPGAAMAPTNETITTRTIACRTTSPVGRPMCWGGHALAAGLGAAGFTGGLMAVDETVRRRRTARRVPEVRP